MLETRMKLAKFIKENPMKVAEFLIEIDCPRHLLNTDAFLCDDGCCDCEKCWNIELDKRNNK